MATAAQRRRLHDSMRYLYGKRAQLHYAQRRPMLSVRLTASQLRYRLNAGHGLTFDCSESVTALCKWAGLRDPNGRHFDGYGYTGTLLAHLPDYSNPKTAMVGALCVFGPGNGDHVAMVYQPGNDPLMWSHGSERGPLLVRWSVEKAYHRAPARFLSIASL